jgi:dTDP-4-amino-4,6-dideoxygalactose transaminase
MAEKIGPGDEVITSPYTFFATAGAIHRVGATPVFVDIDPATFNLDPARLAAAVTPRTRAIIPVHLFGQCCDMDPILDLARARRLVVIEDACQAIGAEYKGRRAGAMGDYGCLSFFPSKNLGGFGDGGMVVANDPARLETLHLLRNHGMKPRYHHQVVGGNFRLDALQAAVLSIKLKHLDGWSAARQANARDYDALFAAVPGVATPAVAPGTTRHIYNQYCIRLPAAKRQAVWDGLRAAGIGCEVYYPVPLHLQECFAHLGHRPGDFPASERAAAESLALPVYPETTHDQRQYVADTLAWLLERA